MRLNRGVLTVKRPVSLVLLLLFAAVQIYFARVPVSHQVQGSTWMEVASQAGGMVQRQGRYFLVTPSDVYRLQATQVHVTADKASLEWLDVPEPSGAGVWKLAIGPSDVPLLGIGGPVYPAPNGQDIIWVDPATHLAYHSVNAPTPMKPLSSEMTAVSQVLWAPDSQAVGLVGNGPSGMGAYVWDRDGNLTPLVLPNGQAPIAALGFSSQNRLLTALSNGTVLLQGRGVLPLPKLSPLYLGKNQGDILGETANHVVFWEHESMQKYQRPDMKWHGRATFSPDGQRAAVLGQNMSGRWSLMTYGPLAQHLTISLPFSQGTVYHLLGFMGDHWILVTVPSGPHVGTYAWWTQN